MAQGKIKISNMLNALIRPEKCPICKNWMDVYKEYNDGHEKLERQCNDCQGLSPNNNIQATNGGFING